MHRSSRFVVRPLSSSIVPKMRNRIKKINKKTHHEVDLEVVTYILIIIQSGKLISIFHNINDILFAHINIWKNWTSIYFFSLVLRQQGVIFINIPWDEIIIFPNTLNPRSYLHGVFSSPMLQPIFEVPCILMFNSSISIFWSSITIKCMIPPIPCVLIFCILKSSLAFISYLISRNIN